MSSAPDGASADLQGIEDLKSLKDAERYLRSVGLSRSQAVAFVSRVKSLAHAKAGVLGGLIRAIDSRTPGTALHTAIKKREMQRELQNAGMTRREAQIEMAKRFKPGD